MFEPELAPDGKHIALCFTQFGAYELRDRSWEEEREAYGRRVIRTLGEYCPNLEGAVEHMEVLAPPDIEERFGLLGGVGREECRRPRRSRACLSASAARALHGAMN